MHNSMSTINVNIDNEVLEGATEILKNLWLTIEEGINLFLEEVVKQGKLPFKVKNPKPSKELLEALKEAEEMIKNPDKYPSYNNMEDLKKALLSDD